MGVPTATVWPFRGSIGKKFRAKGDKNANSFEPGADEAICSKLRELCEQAKRSRDPQEYDTRFLRSRRPWPKADGSDGRRTDDGRYVQGHARLAGNDRRHDRRR